MVLPLGMRINLARNARKIKQRDVARATDILQGPPSNIVNGYRIPSDQELAATLEALHLSSEDLGGVRA